MHECPFSLGDRLANEKLVPDLVSDTDTNWTLYLKFKKKEQNLKPLKLLNYVSNYIGNDFLEVWFYWTHFYTFPKIAHELQNVYFALI